MTTPLEDQLAESLRYIVSMRPDLTYACMQVLTDYDKAKAEPEGTVNREYLAQVCGELTATKLALRDARKEIDALKYHLDGVRKQIRIECDAVDAQADNEWPDDLHLADALEKHLMRPVHHRIEELQKEIDALKTENEKLRNEIKYYDEHLKIENSLHIEAERRLAALTSDEVVSAALHAMRQHSSLSMHNRISGHGEAMRAALTAAITATLTAPRDETEGTV